MDVPTRALRAGVWLAVVVAVLGAAATRAAAQTGMMQAALSQVYVEDSPAAQELIDRAGHLREQGRYTEAAAVYVQVLEQFPMKLMRLEGSLYTDAARWVRRSIADDAPMLEQFRAAYEPEAARQLAAARAEGLDEPALHAVVSLYGLCPSGLEAALDLAALYVERGEGAAAGGVLDEVASHPDLPQHRVRYQALAAVSAALRGDAAAVRHEVAPLGEAAAAQWAQRLLQRRTAAAQSDSPGTLPETFIQPLWTFVTADASGSEQAPMTPSVTVWGDRLYVCDGKTVAALDRGSGRPLWRADNASSEAKLNANLLRMIQNQRLGTDQRAAATDGPSVYAILGPGGTLIPRRQWWPVTSVLTALDARDGSTRWQTTPEALEAGLERTFFHGTPIVRDGRVYALLRRSQVSGFHDAYAVAVDAATGTLLWRRHLSSAAAGARFSARPLAQMIEHAGRLFIIDYLGSITCVDGATGAIRWLQLVGADATTGGRVISQEEMARPSATPVLTAAGLIAPPWEPGAAAVLLDPDTGAQLRALDSADWRGGGELIAVGNDVALLGPTVVCFDGQTLEPRWRKRVVPRTGGQGFSGAAAVSGDVLLAALPGKLIGLRLGDGSVALDRPLSSMGDLAVAQDQVVVAAPAQVASFMSWAQAYELLQRQIRQRPGDPGPGLALAHVAIGNGKPEAALEGVEHAAGALRLSAMFDGADPRAATTEHQALYEQLLALARPAPAPATALDEGAVPAAAPRASVELRRAIFERIAGVAASAAEEAAYRLALGAFEAEQGRIDLAVDQYQSVLLDPTLSAPMHHEAAVARQAGLEAQQRIEALVREHGEGLYARYDLEARQRLAEQLRAGGVDAAPLVELARRYPLSGAAAEALAEAGLRLAGAGTRDQAVTVLRRAYRMTDDPAVLAKVVGVLASAYEQAGRPAMARRWLETAQRQHPGLQPLRGGEPVNPTAWLADLAQQTDAGSALPEVGPNLTAARVVEGVPLPPTSQAPARWRRDAALLRVGDEVVLRGGPDFAERWRAAVGEGAVQLLWLDERAAVLWRPEAGEVLALSADTGAPLWLTVNTAQALEAAGDPAQRAAQNPHQQRFLEEMMLNRPVLVRNGRIAVQRPGGDEPAPSFVQCNEAVIAIADARGRMVGVDRATGQVLWRALSPLQSLTALHLDDEHLAAAGVNNPGTDVQASGVLVLDPLTGEPRFPVIEDSDPIRYLSISPSGLLVYLSGSTVAAHHVSDGTPAWRLQATGSALAGTGWVGEDLLLLAEAEQAGSALFVDLAAGKLQFSTFVSNRPTEHRLQVQPVEQRWHFVTPLAAGALHGDGTLAWRDAIAEPALLRLGQLVTQRYVVLLAVPDAGPVARAVNAPRIIINDRVVEVRQPGAELARAQNASELRLHVLDRQNGTLINTARVDPLEQPLNAAACVPLDNRLILGTHGGASLVIDAPAQP